MGDGCSGSAAVRRASDEVYRTGGFVALDEEKVGKLLEEGGLGVVKEEEAFEGLLGWMKGDCGRSSRGRELLKSIHFWVMEERDLEKKARWMVPEEHWEWTEGLVWEALRAKAESQHLKLGVIATIIHYELIIYFSFNFIVNSYYYTLYSIWNIAFIQQSIYSKIL